MFIPGQIISAITFPGVIVHEAAHQLFCRLMKVPVFEVKYFRFGNPAGYVLHENIDRPMANMLISFGPFFLNTIIGSLIIYPAAVDVLLFENYSNPLAIFLCWLGLSVLMHSFPSTGDAKSLVKSILKNKDVNIFVRIIAAPFIGLIYLGAIGSMFWLDLVYATTVGLSLPGLLARLF